MGRIGHQKVTPDELASELSRSLVEWTNEVAESIDAAANLVTKELLSDIREDSPGTGRAGSYKRGWSRKKLKYSYVVYNRFKPWLTHLLEFGHARRGGGRVNCIPHIKKNEERAKERFEDLCVDIVSEGLRLK